MTVTHGMNLAEVENLGHRLQSDAERLVAICADLEAVVFGSTWAGPDADRFSHDWWPGHKARLLAAGEQLRGFGQSALNNAREQQAASGEGDAGAGAGSSSLQGSSQNLQGSSPYLQGSRPPDSHPSPEAPSASVSAGPGLPGGGYPGWGAPIGADRARELANQYIPAGERAGYDFVNHDGRGDDWYQCTAWARARWRQMGYTGPEWRGDGQDVASNINHLLGRPDATTPTLGAIVSDRGLQHVAVVEELRTGPGGVQQFRVSEMNMGGDGWVDATPDEFRERRWVTLDPSIHRFAAFPG